MNARNDADGHNWLAYAYRKSGQPEQAEHHLRELARICEARCEQYAYLKQAITSYRGRVAAAPKP